MIRPKAILLISIVIFMDLLISSKMTKLPLVYEIYINIGTKVKKRKREPNPHIYPENRNRGCRKSFEKPNATGGFLFQFAAQYIICKAPACKHSHTGPPSSTTNPIRGSAEPFARAKRFLYVCNDANNFYASTLRRYSTPLLPLSRRSCYPSRVRSFRRFAIGIYFLRTNAVIGQAHRATRSRALRRRVLSLLFCVVKGWRVLCETLVNFNFKCRIWLYCELSFYGIKQFLLINPLPYDSFLGYTYR